MKKPDTMINEFNLEPDPRILPMLGEITLAQWRCLAELVDNSVDSFITSRREGRTMAAQEVRLQLPVNDAPNARVSVYDDGPGMPPETLERAVRAGWSGNDPIGNLGMFGMGFNIATARLGTVTTVWTTREGDHEWVGLTIDFDQLRSRRSFKTPRLVRPKTDISQHGTEVTIEKLKPEQRQWLAKPGNRSKVNAELRRVYSAMLRSGGDPISFRLFVNNTRLEGFRHCVWSGPGNTPRAVQTATHGAVDAFHSLNITLPPRSFCIRCWQWLATGETSCAFCDDHGQVVQRPRSIRGWLGIQRYLSETEYGIDFLRNGRKIEILNKDLFVWADGDRIEPEYPTDDPRNRGRIVGEIHLDHCRVTYTKDRFDRHDPAWDDMIRAVRGDGPLRPNKALQANYPPNNSPLYKLYQIFRRSQPRSQTAGAWANLLVVKDNPRAEDMARLFHEGDPAYQTDEKWWELVEEEDRKLLIGKSGATSTGPMVPPGFSATPPTAQSPKGPSQPGGAAPAAGDSASTSPGKPMVSLSQEYVSDSTSLKWPVLAFEVNETAPALLQGRRPWRLRRNTDGNWWFLVNPRHSVFASATMTPLDGLLGELAASAMDFFKDDPGDRSYAQCLSELRLRYAGEFALDPAALSNLARMRLREIAATLPSNISPTDAVELFKELPPDAQTRIREKMALQAVSNANALVAQGHFLEYAPGRVLQDFFVKHPELFLDGKCWDEAYGTLDYGIPSATEMAQQRVVWTYQSLLADVVWLVEQEPIEVSESAKPQVLRAMHALELLAPANTDEAAE